MPRKKRGEKRKTKSKSIRGPLPKTSSERDKRGLQAIKKFMFGETDEEGRTIIRDAKGNPIPVNAGLGPMVGDIGPGGVPGGARTVINLAKEAIRGGGKGASKAAAAKVLKTAAEVAEEKAKKAVTKKVAKKVSKRARKARAKKAAKKPKTPAQKASKETPLRTSKEITGESWVKEHTKRKPPQKLKSAKERAMEKTAPPQKPEKVKPIGKAPWPEAKAGQSMPSNMAKGLERSLTKDIESLTKRIKDLKKGSRPDTADKARRVRELVDRRNKAEKTLKKIREISETGAPPKTTREKIMERARGVTGGALPGVRDISKEKKKKKKAEEGK